MKRNLDNQAKIFSLSYNKKDTSIFRISITLKNNIEEKYLHQAVERTLKIFKDFKVKLTQNMFWNYFIENDNKIPVHTKIDYKFTKINTKENNEYPFKISYERNLLVVDFIHLLTDGIGSKLFIEELLYNYLRLIDHRLIPQKKLKISSENSYTPNYTGKYNKIYIPPKCHQLQGKYIPNKNISFNEINIDLESLKKTSQEKECTISELIISLITFSLYRTNYKSNKPINICVPVNLRKYFPTNTISNFVSHSILSIKPSNIETLDNMIYIVKKEYRNKIDESKIKDIFESMGKLINNKLLNYIPLLLKRQIVILGSYFIKQRLTFTYSNLGVFELNKDYNKHIKNISFQPIPNWKERIRCGITLYQNTLNISFCSNLTDTSLEKKLIQLLDELNVDYDITNNKINPIKFD